MNGDDITKIRQPGRIGTEIELKACIHFMEQGYEVFRNVCGSGPADIIILDKTTGEMKKIDVKKMSHHLSRTTGEPYLYLKKQRTDIQRKLGIDILLYEPVSGEFMPAEYTQEAS